MSIKAVFFDLDGTLVDSNDMHVLAWEEAFSGAGLSFGRDIIHAQIGKGADKLVPALLPEADESAVERLGEVQGSIFRERYLGAVKPFPGAHDLLARTHAAGKAVVFASSASKGDLDHYVELLGARDLLNVSTSADDVANTKPAPDIFATALKALAPLTADEVTVVGDTPYDIAAAAACGIQAVALRSGKFSDEDLSRAGPIAIYDNAAALVSDYDNSPLGR